jgi:hypothetical protein
MEASRRREELVGTYGFGNAENFGVHRDSGNIAKPMWRS